MSNKVDKTVTSVLDKRRSIFWVQQHLLDGNGKELIDIDDVLDILKSKLPSDTFWALIRHDKDPDPDDETKLKPEHIHIFIRLKVNNYSISTMAELLGISAQNFVLPEKIRHMGYRVKGLDVDAHCIQYMTHEHNEEKAQYSEDCIISSDKSQLQHLLAIDIVPPAAREAKVKALIEQIVTGGTTLMTYCNSTEFDPVLLVEKYSKLSQAEQQRLLLHAPRIEARKTIFVSGYGSACGKTSLALSLAREIAIRDYDAPVSLDPRAVNPYIFTLSSNTGWNGYASQRIVIIDDIRAGSLKLVLGDRSSVKNFFDPHPAPIRLNIKHSTVLPAAEWVIITSIDCLDEYLNQLASSAYSDDDKIEQYSRRIAASIFIDKDLCAFEEFEDGYYHINRAFSFYCPARNLALVNAGRESWAKALASVVDCLFDYSFVDTGDSSIDIDFEKLGHIESMDVAPNPAFPENNHVMSN